MHTAIPKHANVQVSHRGRSHNAHVLKVRIASMIVVRNLRERAWALSSPCVVAMPTANEPSRHDNGACSYGST